MTFCLYKKKRYIIFSHFSSYESRSLQQLKKEKLKIKLKKANILSFRSRHCQLLYELSPQRTQINSYKEKLDRQIEKTNRQRERERVKRETCERHFSQKFTYENSDVLNRLNSKRSVYQSQKLLFFFLLILLVQFDQTAL